jgi:hypothetical protein
MLDEDEYKQISPHLSDAIRQIQQYRQEHNVSLAEAKRDGYGREALRVYADMTGYQEIDPDRLWHHRLSRFGPPCHACGKPLRTPRAKFCAECGVSRENSLTPV